ncbi:MAG: S1C family serine protease [Sphaerochaetaceae bacterium]
MNSSSPIKRSSVLKTFKLIVIGIIIIVLGVGIIVWTRSLYKKEQYQKEREVLAKILEKHGELGLLERAGVEVNDIFYGEQGITIFLDQPSAFQYSSEEMRNIAIYEKANKSVVHITTISSALNTFLEILPVQGTGSGIILSESGYILTNAHVVRGANQLSISLHDGTSYEGQLIGLDAENDLAVLKIDVPQSVKLLPIELGSAKDLKVGQKVVTIGNPFGYDRTMTSGTVSGLGRPVKIDNNTIINGMIQTDAAINPGNSGGPLLNSLGQMIGIATTIHSTTGSSSGVGFAIPVDTAIAVIPDLLKYGKVVRGWLDVTLVQLDAAIVNYAELPVDNGLLVSQVRSGGKAEKGGLKGGTKQVQYGQSIINLGGDIITKINGQKISDYTDLFSALVDTRPQQTVTIEVIRNKETKTLKVELIERPEGLQWTVQ